MVLLSTVSSLRPKAASRVLVLRWSFTTLTLRIVGARLFDLRIWGHPGKFKIFIDVSQVKLEVAVLSLYDTHLHSVCVDP